MATATTVPRLTYADLDFIPQRREGDRHELFDGELVVTPSPIPVHQLISGNAFSIFDRIVRPNQLGRVFAAPIDVKLTPAIVMIPDIVFVSRERLGIVGAKAILDAPDLVVEILSPSTRRRDLGRKRGIYERFGVLEYWVIDPKTRTVTIFVLRAGRYELLPIEGGVIRSTVLTGQEIAVAALFEGL